METSARIWVECVKNERFYTKLNIPVLVAEDNDYQHDRWGNTLPFSPSTAYDVWWRFLWDTKIENIGEMTHHPVGKCVCRQQW